METKSNFLKTKGAQIVHCFASKHLQQQEADNAKTVLVAQLFILQKVLDKRRPSVLTMSRSPKPVMHISLDIPSHPNLLLFASSHGDGIIVGGYRRVSPMIRSYKSFLHMIAGVSVTRAVFVSQQKSRGALRVAKIISEMTHDNPPYMQISAHVVPDVTHVLPKTSFLVHTVNNPACKWVANYTSTGQCLIVKHMQNLISPTALNWKAIPFPANVSLEFTSDFDMRGAPTAKGRFQNIAQLHDFTRGFNGFEQRSV